MFSKICTSGSRAFKAQQPFKNFKRNNSAIIGIDLGTTNSCVAVMEGSQPRVIENSEGHRTTPSVVAWLPDGERVVGITAKRQMATNPKNTLYATKRLIGRRFSDPQTQTQIKSVGYKIVEASNGDAWCEVNGKQISPSEVGSYVLVKMKETAEKHLGYTPSRAVVTVPAYFNDAQRQATKDAGTIAGLKVERIINEPTAAALAYGLNDRRDSKIAVYDLGGGTFDISILKIENNTFEVLATNGDTFLGGEDFDNLLTKYILTEFQNSSKLDLSNDKIAIQRIREAAENAKIELSSNLKSTVNIPYISTGADGPIHLKLDITRDQYESMCKSLVKKSLIPCEKCLDDAGVLKTQLNEVILVGGMTRTPLVVKMVEGFFERQAFQGVNPDESVALGAAIQSAILTGSAGGLVLLDVTPLSLGTNVVGDIFVRIIERNTPIPTKATKEFTTCSDGQTDISFEVYQGEREIASQNRLLGKLSLTGIVPARQGVPKHLVTFEIDSNGILNITCMDTFTEKSKSLQVKASSGLSKSEIDEMVMSAKIHEERDKERKGRIQAINEAELLIDRAFKNMKEFAQHTTDTGRASLKEALNELQDLVDDDSSSVQDLKAGIANCKKIEMDIFAEAYNARRKEKKGEATPEEDKDEDDDVDEGEDMKQKKK